MPKDPIFDHTRDVSLFSRASLLMTFDLLRPNNPQLALEVRNITGGEPLPRDPDDEPDRNGDIFRVELSSQQVRAVVQGLMEFTQPEAVDIRNPEINIMARALMQDWLLLAHKIVANQPLYPDLADEHHAGMDTDPDAPRT